MFNYQRACHATSSCFMQLHNSVASWLHWRLNTFSFSPINVILDNTTGHPGFSSFLVLHATPQQRGQL